MKKNKRGVSPLIATVLIIGFTIVLAAMIMMWGTDLVKGIQEQTSKSSEIKLTCSSKLTELQVKAKKNKDTDTYTVTVNNANDVDLAGFIFRLYDTEGTNVQAFDTHTDSNLKKIKVGDKSLEGLKGDALDAARGVPAFGVKTFKFSSPGFEVVKVGVFPKVMIQDVAETCSNEVKARVG